MRKYHVFLINLNDKTSNQITEKSLSFQELLIWSNEFIQLNEKAIKQREILLAIKQEGVKHEIL